VADIHQGRGYVYSLQYHLVWCVKYRRQVLTGQAAEDLKQLLETIASDNGFRILEMETMEDHVPLMLDCTPQHYLPSLAKALKGVWARLLFKAHPELKQQLWGGHLWNPSYFAATVSEQTEAQISNYLRSQKGKGPHASA